MRREPISYVINLSEREIRFPATNTVELMHSSVMRATQSISREDIYLIAKLEEPFETVEKEDTILSF